MGPEAAKLVEAEGRRYASIPAYGDHFARMGASPSATAVAARTAAEIPDALARWERVLDDVVVRAVTASDALDQTLELVRAAGPS
jgi:phage baseplate assembly protein W